MASASNISRPSIFPLSSALPTERVGRNNPIALPLIEIAAIGRTIGEKIKDGSCGSIYNVSGSNPQRVYKAIPLERLKNGDEIRICQVAAQVGVAPVFYGACLVQQREDRFVFIEMDNAGKSLFRWMEDLALEPDVSNAALIEESSTQKARAKAMRELADQEDDGSGFMVVSCDSVKTVSMEEAVDKLYTSREDFFFELFTAYKILAENKIAYRDGNCGNFIPNRGNGLRLIDFDSALIAKSQAEAASKTVQSMYNHVHFKDFRALKDLSSKSKELIEWFETQQRNALMEQLGQAFLS